MKGAAMEKTEVEESYLLMSRARSTEVAVWWRANAKGYTSNLHEAGRFTQAEAMHWEQISQRQALAVPEGALSLLTVRAILDLGDGRNAAWLNVLATAHDFKPAFSPDSKTVSQAQPQASTQPTAQNLGAAA